MSLEGLCTLFVALVNMYKLVPRFYIYMSLSSVQVFTLDKLVANSHSPQSLPVELIVTLLVHFESTTI